MERIATRRSFVAEAVIAGGAVLLPKRLFARAAPEIPVASNMAELASLPVGVWRSAPLIYLAAYRTQGDGGNGLFRFDPDSAAEPDGGIVVGPPGSSCDGRAIRQLEGAVTGAHFGLTPHASDRVENTSRANAALSAALERGAEYKHVPHLVPCNAQIVAPLGLRRASFMGGGFDFSEATGEFPARGGFVSAGRFAPLPSLRSDAGKGDRQIVLQQAPAGIAPGSVIFVGSSTNWNPARAYYKKGEACLVDKVEGERIFLTHPIYDDYAAATAKLGLLNQNNITIEDLVVRGDRTRGMNAAIHLFGLGPQASIRNCKGESFNYAGISLSRCINSEVTKPQGYKLSADNGAGASYGIVVVNCQGVTVHGGDAVGARHGVSIGGDSAPYNIVNRNIVFDGINASNAPSSATPVAGFDWHGNCENCTVKNAAIVGGVNIGGAGNVVTGTTRVTAGSGFRTGATAFLLTEPLTLDHQIDETVSVVFRGAQPSSYGLILDFATSDGGLAPEISGGIFTMWADTIYTISGAGEATQYIVRAQSRGSASAIEVDLSRARFRMTSNDATFGGGIFMSGTAFRRVVLPRKRSTFFADLRDVAIIDGDDIACDCVGLGRKPNIYFLHSRGRVSFNRATGFGGALDFIMTDQGSGYAPEIVLAGLTLSGYGGRAIDLDTGGSVTIGPGNQLGGRGIILKSCHAVQLIRGADDGPVDVGCGRATP